MWVCISKLEHVTNILRDMVIKGIFILTLTINLGGQGLILLLMVDYEDFTCHLLRPSISVRYHHSNFTAFDLEVQGHILFH